MTFNCDIHHRRSIRLKSYDYAQPGLYFVTLCAQHRKCIFGKIVAGEMHLSPIGHCALVEWQKLPDRFANIQLDAFVVMPNHIHLIIQFNPVGAPLAGAKNADAPNTGTINDRPTAMDGRATARVAPTDALHMSNANNRSPVGAPLAGAQTVDALNTTDTNNRATARVAPTLGNVIGAYKSLVVHQALVIAKQNGEHLGELWQRNYWEHVVRNEEGLKKIRDYILNNPLQWEQDQLYVVPGAESSEHAEALYYVQQTQAHGWSRSVLTHQIESGLWQRDGKALTNFAQTLPAPQSDLAAQVLKASC